MNKDKAKLNTVFTSIAINNKNAMRSSLLWRKAKGFVDKYPPVCYNNVKFE